MKVCFIGIYYISCTGIVPWDADDDVLVNSCLIPVTANIIDLGGRDVGVNLTGPVISCSTMIISAPNQTLANQYSSSIKGEVKKYLKILKKYLFCVL